MKFFHAKKQPEIRVLIISDNPKVTPWWRALSQDCPRQYGNLLTLFTIFAG